MTRHRPSDDRSAAWLWKEPVGPFFEQPFAAHRAPRATWLHRHRQVLLWSCNGAALALLFAFHPEQAPRLYDGLRWAFADLPWNVVFGLALSFLSVVTVDSLWLAMASGDPSAFRARAAPSGRRVSLALLLALLCVQVYHMLPLLVQQQVRIGSCLFVMFFWIGLSAKTWSFLALRCSAPDRVVDLSFRSPVDNRIPPADSAYETMRGSSGSPLSHAVETAPTSAEPLSTGATALPAVAPMLPARTASSVSYLEFLLHPSLVYRAHVPRLPQRRWHRMLAELSATLGCFLLAHLLHVFVILPVLYSRTLSMPEQMALLLLPCHVSFCCVFYGHWHALMCTMAELLCLADRRGLFAAWFIEPRTEGYFRAWSVPVHRWLREHVSRPLSRRVPLLGPVSAFLLSGLVHELALYGVVHAFSVPFMGVMLMAVCAVIVVERATPLRLPPAVLHSLDFAGHAALYVVCGPAVLPRLAAYSPGAP